MNEIDPAEKAKSIKQKPDKHGMIRKGASAGLIYEKRSVRSTYCKGQNSPNDYAQDKISAASDSAGFAAEKAVGSVQNGSSKAIQKIKQRNISAKDIKQTEKSSGKRKIKTVEHDINKAGHQIKTTEETARTAVSTGTQAGNFEKKSAQAAQAASKAAKKSAEQAKRAAKMAEENVKAAARGVSAAVRSIKEGMKSLVAIIAAGGWVAVLIIVIICLVALIACSCFGIFLSGGDAKSTMSLDVAINRIDAEYQGRINELKRTTAHDVAEIHGYEIDWKNVLAVYAVKTTGSEDSPKQIASMDEESYKQLYGVFWDMHYITKRTEKKEETVIKKEKDKDGKIVEVPVKVKRTYLYIDVTHKSPDEMKTYYRFNATQVKQLDELLSEENDSMWDALLKDLS